MQCDSSFAPPFELAAAEISSLDPAAPPIASGARVKITAGSLAGLVGRAVKQDREEKWIVEVPGLARGALFRLAAGSLAVVRQWK